MRPILMERHGIRFACIALLCCSPVVAPAQAPQSKASAMMTQARTEAAADHKSILAVFSASWCGPCHMFEAFLNDSKIKPIMDCEFVTVVFDVGERPDDKLHADTPGGVDLRASLAGHSEVGYPYIAMIDPAGKPIVDSLRPDHGTKSNIGYPDLPVEIDWFMQMLQQAAPSLSPEDAKTIKQWLQDHSHHS